MLFCGIGLANAAQLVTGSYATATPSRALPGGAVAAWVTEELRLLAFGAIVLSLLLFPTGRLPSWRWRWVVGLGAVGQAALMAREGLTPGPSQELLGHRNPFGLTGVPGLLDGLGLVEELFYLAELAAVLSLVLRLRRARGVERQQLKWFVYAAVVVLVLANLLFYDLMEHGPLGNLLWGAAPVSLAVAVAVAVLPAVRDRPRHPVGRAAGGGRPDGATFPNVAVAATEGFPAVTGTVTMPERWDGTTALEEVP
jgi:hypothetical protein